MKLTMNVIKIAFGTHISQQRILRDSMRYQGLGFIGGSKVQSDRLYIVSPEQVNQVLNASCIICTTEASASLDLLRASQCDYVVLDGSLSLGQIYESVSETFREYDMYEKRLHLALASDAVITEYLNVISDTFKAAVLLVDTSFRILGYNTNMKKQDYPVHVYESIQKKYCTTDSLSNIDKHFDPSKYSTSSEAMFTDAPPYEKYISVNYIESGSRRLTLSVHECAGQTLRPEWGTLFEDTLNLFVRFYKPVTSVLDGQLLKWINVLRDGGEFNEDILQMEIKSRLWGSTDCFQILYIRLSKELVDKGLTGMFTNLLQEQHPDSIIDTSNYDLIQLLHHGVGTVPADPIIPSDSLVSLLKAWNLSIGVSSAFTDLRQMPDYLEYAKYANAYSEKKSLVISYYKDIVIDHFIDQLQANHHDPSTLCSPYILRLQQYDRENGTNYLKTMYVYLSHERHLVSSARALYIHRNTLVARLEKINDLFGSGNVEDFYTRIHMILSCIIMLRDGNGSLGTVSRYSEN